MMTLLRSRRFKVVLAVVVVTGLVLSGLWGLFSSFRAPVTSPAEAPTSASPLEAPDVDVLGEPPEGLAYASDDTEDVQCTRAECFRLVQVVTDGGEPVPDSEEAIESVYRHLLDADWGQLLPEGAESPDDVPLGETFLTDGQVLVTDSSDHSAQDAPALLMLAGAAPPAS
ncbi:hypothetical protein [Nocardiopsis sp. LOL_012]|uniref:hypothetical protein n=1 Tax=Nocardiopsis sp. LOL_012 TaxID=3345409 RepID=UPI003A848D99